MLPIEDQLSLLVHLSKADNFVAKEERELIHAIGKRNGLSVVEVDKIIESPHPLADLKYLPAEEKFDCLLGVIQLMKVDKKVYQKEIDFCERFALKLGYKPSVIADLSAYIYSDPTIASKRSFLKSIADQHLIPKVVD